MSKTSMFRKLHDRTQCERCHDYFSYFKSEEEIPKLCPDCERRTKRLHRAPINRQFARANRLGTYNKS